MTPQVDWKVLVINVADPKAALVNSLADCEVHFPGQVARVREWFTWYKVRRGRGYRSAPRVVPPPRADDAA